MTVKYIYESVLRELRKNRASHLHLDDFIYYLNKIIQSNVNVSYSNYVITQKLADDIAALRKPLVYTFQLNNQGSTVTYYDPRNPANTNQAPVDFHKKYGNYTVVVPLRPDYFHILSGHISLNVYKPTACYPEGHVVTTKLVRFSDEVHTEITNNDWLKPAIDRQYYTTTGLPTLINDSKMGLEITFGGNGEYLPSKVEIDYLKKPQEVSMTVSDVSSVIDNSMEVEFNDDYCRELISSLTIMLLERSGDQRLGSYASIAYAGQNQRGEKK